MSVTVFLDSDLERLFVSKVTAHPSRMPSRHKDYISTYKVIKETLATKYYQSTGSALGQSGSRFTRHDITHVDDVIDIAGRIIGIDKSSVDDSLITPYETFVLLLAILVHDAGNAYERHGHEIMAAQILRDLGTSSPLNEIERRLIAGIASAHGGRTPNNDRATIEDRVKEDVSEIDGFKVNGRRIAALVRLADEFSERSRRADSIALETRKPSESYLPNYFCQSVNVKIDSASRSASMDFHVEKSSLTEMHPDPENGNKGTLIVDYIAKRLDKADLERRYCNRFLSGWRPMDTFRSSIKIYENDVEIDALSATLSDTGYPSLNRTPAFDGEAIKSKFSELVK